MPCCAGPAPCMVHAHASKQGMAPCVSNCVEGSSWQAPWEAWLVSANTVLLYRTHVPPASKPQLEACGQFSRLAVLLPGTCVPQYRSGLSVGGCTACHMGCTVPWCLWCASSVRPPSVQLCAALYELLGMLHSGRVCGFCFLSLVCTYIHVLAVVLCAIIQTVVVLQVPVVGVVQRHNGVLGAARLAGAVHGLYKIIMLAVCSACGMAVLWS